MMTLEFVPCICEKRMASGKMPIGLYKNNVTAENCIFLLPVWYVTFSILGDTADFGRIKKKKERFPLLPLLKPAKIERRMRLFNFKQQSVSEVYTSDTEYSAQ
jgi:hypothetical protein